MEFLPKTEACKVEKEYEALTNEEKMLEQEKTKLWCKLKLSLIESKEELKFCLSREEFRDPLCSLLKVHGYSVGVSPAGGVLSISWKE